MSWLRTVAFTTGLAAAIIATVVASALSVSSTNANANAASIGRLIPNYMLRWDNTFLAPETVAPAPGR